MKKSEVKRLLEKGKCQIYNDAPEKFELLNEITGNYVRSGKYYFLDNCSEYPYQIMKIIKLSDITEDEDVVWKGSETEVSFNNGVVWNKCNDANLYRLTPKLQKEIQSLYDAAKELGYKITLEKL